MTPEQLTEQLQTVLFELHGVRTVTLGTLTEAGKLIGDRQKARHRSEHAERQRGGAIVWAMRERGMSWREIYDATGIVQKTGDTWMRLFLAEGIGDQPGTELDERWTGKPEGEQS